MATVAPPQVGMSLAAFIEQYDNEPFELIDGEVVPMSPSVLGPSRIASRLERTINNYAEPNGLGEAIVEAVFVLAIPEDKKWVKGSRVPDVLFVKGDRFAAYMEANPDWETEPLVLVPDLVVEVVSPTDKFTNVNNKVEKYLHDGVQVVWVIDPQARTITIFAADGGQYSVLHEDDTLSGGQIIPGFEVTVAEILA